MNEVLDKNLKLLYKYQPEVYKKIEMYIEKRYTPKNGLVDRIVLVRQDDLVINMMVEKDNKEYLICNHEDPIGEAYAWIDKFIDPSNKADIVFGMGFGYHLEVLLTGFKKKKVIIVEPDIELFYQILSIRNLELIIKKSEIFLDEAIEPVLARLNTLMWDTESGGIQCEPFEVYGYVFKSLWDELRNKFIKQAENFNVDFATKRRFGELWASNSIKNSSKLSQVSNSQGLIGGFKNIPGILVSSGPSLQKNIHLIKELKDKCLILAAGTAVKKLEESGITPHFMVGIDASDEEGELHKSVKSSEICFVYTNQISTISLDSYKGPKFFMNYPVDMFSAELMRFLNVKSEFFLSGPSVSNTAADILFKMGCNPIILLGQDLAYTGVEVTGEKEPNQNMVIDKDIYGNDIYTNQVFISMRNWFEGYFEKIKLKTRVINATEGGLNIGNAENVSLIDAIKELNIEKSDIGSIVRAIYNKNRFPEDFDQKYSEFKNKVISEIKKFERLFDEQESILQSIKIGTYHPAKNKKVFEKMTRRVSEITDMLIGSGIYNMLLKNMIDIDFYFIKLEADRAIMELNEYEKVKEVFTQAVKHQITLTREKIAIIKKDLSKDQLPLIKA